VTASADSGRSTTSSPQGDEVVLALIEGLIDYTDFERSLGVLQLVQHLQPRFIPIMMRQAPQPELLRSDSVVLQNLLIHVDDSSLGRFIGAAGEKIAVRLLEHISTNRRVRIATIIESWRELLHTGDYKPSHKLVYYLSYLFLYQQMKPYI
jgi:hypothetical protein